jgi:hypothetical protein
MVLLLAAGKPTWVSFTLEDSTAACLRDKQPLAAALQQLHGHANLAAVLVNCCAPAAVTAAIPVLKQHAPAGEVPAAHMLLLLFCSMKPCTRATCSSSSWLPWTGVRAGSLPYGGREVIAPHNGLVVCCSKQAWLLDEASADAVCVSFVRAQAWRSAAMPMASRPPRVSG